MDPSIRPRSIEVQGYLTALQELGTYFERNMPVRGVDLQFGEIFWTFRLAAYYFVSLMQDFALKPSTAACHPNERIAEVRPSQEGRNRDPLLPVVV